MYNIAAYVLQCNIIIMSEISQWVELLNKIEESATKTEEVKTESTNVEEVKQEPIKVEDVVITDSNSETDIWTATVVTDVVEDWKPLSEYAYDIVSDELKKKAEEDMLNSIKEEDMPEVQISQIEKEKAIEEITNDITETIEENSNKSPDEVFEAIATDLYSKIEKKESEIKIWKSKCDDLEEIVKNLNSEMIKLKHWSDKIEIIDDFFGKFAVTYWDWKKSENDAEKIKLSTKLATILLWWTKMVYPEIDVKEVLDMVSEKRNKWIKAIQDMNQWSQRDIEIKEKSANVYRPSPYVFSK